MRNILFKRYSRALSIEGTGLKRHFFVIVCLIFLLPIVSILYVINREGGLFIPDKPGMFVLAFSLCASLAGIIMLRRVFENFVSVRNAIKKAEIGEAFRVETGGTAEAMEISGTLERFRKELDEWKKELEDNERELDTVRENLYHACRLSHLGEVTASIAHEINQPLNVIGLLSQAALMEAKEGYMSALHPKTLEKIAKIDAQVVKIRTIIDQMMAFARRDNGKSMKPVIIQDVLESALSIMGQQLKISGVKVEKDFIASLSPVFANPVRIEQVFLNLISNAKDAMAGKYERRLKICGKNYGGMVVVEFVDTGGGIDKDIKEKIFKPFFTTKQKGMGLGLSISHGIVREHGGELHLDVVEGIGSIFRVCLPESSPAYIRQLEENSSRALS